VTELVTGIDLVAWQLRVAAGERLTIAQDDVVLTGHAIEARVYAEDPESGFLPSTGTVVALAEAAGDGVRVDSSLVDGLVVSPHYDPMLAKVIAWGSDRAQALSRLDGALASTTILGVRTNLEYLRALLADLDVRSGDLDTTLIERRLPGLAFRRPDDALLAAAALYLRAERHADGVWQARDGWRMGGVPRASRFRFAISPTECRDVLVSGGAATAASTVVTASTVMIGDETHTARLTAVAAGSHTAALVEFDGVSSRWTIARDGATLWLGQDGFSWPLGIVGRDAEIAEMVSDIELAEKPRRPEVRSPMPGTVVTVSVANGDQVEAGDTIITVEAMKMEHKLTAPVAGMVSLTATPGDLVKLDQLLASITVVLDTVHKTEEYT
jgi:acetyl-CoA/propionyl-CoA carboxylase biotin carboxyl carrier protein